MAGSRKGPELPGGLIIFRLFPSISHAGKVKILEKALFLALKAPYKDRIK